ncbi:hypothetical protein K438DRAFT_2028985 [Mycena galopus ATCC 62051]|nr:hypothetical protein K438DRAFT_2028985 [Mycena galopus ATCC 62051]
MSPAGSSSTGTSRAPHCRAGVQTWCSEVSDTDSAADSDPAIHAGLHDQGDNSQTWFNHISGGQGGSGGSGGVHGGSGGTGHGPSFSYDIAAETVNVVSHVHPSQAVVHTVQVLNYCPPPSRIFYGRRVILDAMHHFFNEDTQEQHIYVLHGLGGAGKTQIALKFIKEFSRFTHRLLLDTSTTETIETGLKTIATAKELGNSAQDALRWLETQHEDWLLLFDNADDPKINLNSFFPKCCHGNIVITTRNPNLRVYGTHSQVSDMEETDAIALLLRSAAQQTSMTNKLLAAEIVKVLWYLPLAIVQAGAFISESGTLNTYLVLYSKSQAKLLAEKPSQTHDNYAWTVYTTWQMSFDRLSPQAAMFLQLCSFLHQDGISEDIFSRAAIRLMKTTNEWEDTDEIEDGNKGEKRPAKHQKLDLHHVSPWFQPPSQSRISSMDSTKHTQEFLSQFLDKGGKWDSLCFLKVTNEVKAYSLISFDAEQKWFSIHPLVHNWSKTTLTHPDSAYSCMGEILGMSIAEISSADIQLASLRLASHVDSLMQLEVGRFELQHARINQISRFGLQYSRIYYEARLYTKAANLEAAVLEERKRLLGDRHVHTLSAMQARAATYRTFGQFQEAEKLDLVVLEERSKLCGADHLETLTAMQNLAVTYGFLGRFQEAEKLQLVVLEKRRKLLGDDHLDTLNDIHALAITYDGLDQFEEAEKLKVVVLEKRRKLLGDDHPETLGAMNNLAFTYDKLSRFEEAEKLQLVALEKRRKLLGDDHLDTLNNIHALAITYDDLGRFEEAETLKVIVLEKRRKLLGKDHPDTLCAMNNLAHTYNCLGHFEKAWELQASVVEKDRKLHGDNHPSTQISMETLVDVYRGLGKQTEADELEKLIKRKT